MSSWHRTGPAVNDGKYPQPEFIPRSIPPPKALPPAPWQGQDGRGDWPLRSYLELAALETAPSCARLHAKARLAEWGLSALADDAELVVSELVTNSLLAPPELEENPALIRLWLLGAVGQLVVVVWDGSRQPPELAQVPAMAENGRGVWLISELSSDWGWYGHPDMGGKCVWAEFRIPSPGTLA
jgi:anti-sigma regulatory factor (Ser/Thr protein kinase)